MPWKPEKPVKNPLLKPLLLTLALLPPACGGSGQDIAKDPASALEQGNKASSSKDYDTAERAYASVADDTSADPSLRKEALLGLGETQAAVGKGKEASSTFDQLQKEYGDGLNLQSVRRIVEAFIKSGDADRAHEKLQWASAKFKNPAAQKVFSTLDMGIKALQAGDSSILKELGYAGD